MARRWVLTWLLLRPTLGIAILGAVTLGSYCLMHDDVMTPHEAFPAMIILVQCLMLGAMHGRVRSPSFAFVYSRGYSRDAIWGHMMLASCLCVLATLLPAALIIWTGYRSQVLDHMQSRYFPIMAPREMCVPLVWLGFYGLLVPACHYAWIRRAQPTTGRHGGNGVVAVLLVTVAVAFYLVRYLNGWLAWLAGALYVTVVLCLVLGGRALHRSLEVQA